jgi:predicted XRE-type DNA-binding protein
MDNCDTKLANLSRQEIKRFWSRVDRRDPDECWPWLKRADKDGYGIISFQFVQLRTHRVAFFLSTNIQPLRMKVLHQCDNPPCCNPAHLFLGTPAQNMLDKCAKGRESKGAKHSASMNSDLRKGDLNGARLHIERMPRGEANGNAKFTPEIVRAIRRRYAAGGIYQHQLAKQYHVTQAVISQIVSGKTWRHIL